MLPDQVGIAKAEGWMVLTECNQVLVVIKDLRISMFVRPVEVVNAVRRLKGVMNTLFRAEQFLATEHERHTLRSKHSRLRQQVEADEFSLADARN